jgi:putative phage-type endonuclease
MKKNLGSKHKNIIMSKFKEKFINKKYSNADEIKTDTEEVLDELNLELVLSRDIVFEYLNSFIHQHEDCHLYLNPDKKKTTRIKVGKKKIKQDTVFEKIVLGDHPSKVLDNSDTKEDPISEDLDELAKQFSFHVQGQNERHFGNGYVYPSETQYNVVQHTESELGPYGTQWIHEKQKNDVLDQDQIRRRDKIKELKNIVYPEQRSKEWFIMRESKITASDIGCVTGDNKYEQTYKFILKKVFGSPFKGNENTYHGKKYEKIATMAYEYRMNVIVDEFGMVCHPTIRFLGASPDGIIGEFKSDGKSLTKHVGRMLEIKCPATRKIKITDDIEETCPIYYLCQVLLQLEVCELDECDFWQVKLYEYKDRQEFIDDTDKKEPFRSRKTRCEKGCLIQLMPKNHKIEIIEKDEEKSRQNYLESVWDKATHIYPPKIEMSPYECDKWILDTCSKVNTDPAYFGSYIDRIIYWRIDVAHSVTIPRNKEWFKEKLPIMEKVWLQVEFFRKNKKEKDLLEAYVKSLGIDMTVEDKDRVFNTKAINNKVLGVTKMLMRPNNSKEIALLMKEIEENNKNGVNPGSQYSKFVSYDNNDAGCEDGGSEFEEVTIVD